MTSRRNFLRGSGALIVTFSLTGCAAARAQGIDASATPETPATAVATEVREQQPVPSPSAVPSASRTAPFQANQVDSWLAVNQDGSVTIYSGRVELGTGVRTALAQIAADELYVPFQSISMVQGDTARTPDEGYTAGSKTMQVGGVAVRKAAAEARQALLEMASNRLGVGQDALTIQNGVISGGGQSVGYGELIGNQVFNRTISDQTPL
jgi:CO/xanthine dehydrogenase Mo-binding subunit